MKGPNVIRGYWNKPEATAETIVDGWLRTGDLGRMDEEGFVYIEDRAKDMILRGGENVYSAEVEAAIYEHPNVYEAAVFGLPHERLGEEVAVAVVPARAPTIDSDELRDVPQPPHRAVQDPPKVFLFDEALPRNPAGKILKRQLRDELAEQLTAGFCRGQLRAPRPGATFGEAVLLPAPRPRRRPAPARTPR
jgi:long-chain acyl-CoA synthetase